MCGQLKTHAAFVACHANVNPLPFYKNCMFDVCECVGANDVDCLCRAIAVYSRMCAINGVYLLWREEQFCGKIYIYSLS